METGKMSDIEFAELLYMRGVSQKEIAGRIGKSESTISEWGQRLGWKEKRASIKISRGEMVTKILARIDDIIGRSDSSIDTVELSRLAKVIRSIDKSIGIADYIDCFMALGAWLQTRPEVAADVQSSIFSSGESFFIKLQKAVNAVQDKFVNEMLVKKNG